MRGAPSSLLPSWLQLVPFAVCAGVGWFNVTNVSSASLRPKRVFRFGLFVSFRAICSFRVICFVSGYFVPGLRGVECFVSSDLLRFGLFEHVVPC